MKEMDRITQYTQNNEKVQWQHIKNPDVFYTMVTKDKIPVEQKERTWICPKTGCGKEYASQAQLHRHLYSYIAQGSTLNDPRTSACFIQLPPDEMQARAEVERHETLPPRTQYCPFGTPTCQSNPDKKVPTCTFCQNVKRQIAEGSKSKYPKQNAYMRSLRKRK